MQPLKALLNSRKFWVAGLAMIAKLVFYFIPSFPAEIWDSIEILAGVLIAAIALEDAAQKLGNGKA